MKAIKCASLDGFEVDFISVSEVDGEELECYVSQRFLEKTKGSVYHTEHGEIMDYEIADEDVSSHVKESVERENLIQVKPGGFDFCS